MVSTLSRGSQTRCRRQVETGLLLRRAASNVHILVAFGGGRCLVHCLAEPRPARLLLLLLPHGDGRACLDIAYCPFWPVALPWSYGLAIPMAGLRGEQGGLPSRIGELCRPRGILFVADLTTPSLIFAAHAV